MNGVRCALECRSWFDKSTLPSYLDSLCPAAAPASEAVPPQPQRGPRNGRDDRDRVSSGRGGRGGMSFPPSGPSNRDRMARGGSKGPDGAADSGQSMSKFIFSSCVYAIQVEVLSVCPSVALKPTRPRRYCGSALFFIFVPISCHHSIFSCI